MTSRFIPLIPHHIAYTLDAIRCGHSGELEILLLGIKDRQQFFTAHYPGIASALLESGSEAGLLVLLRQGWIPDSRLIEQLYDKGHPPTQKVLEDFKNQCKARERWIREAQYFKDKYRYKIVWKLNTLPYQRR